VARITFFAANACSAAVESLGEPAAICRSGVAPVMYDLSRCMKGSRAESDPSPRWSG
jgi:hypothetical protein